MNVYQKALASLSWASHNPINNSDPSRPPSSSSGMASASAATAVAVAVNNTVPSPSSSGMASASAGAAPSTAGRGASTASATTGNTLGPASPVPVPVTTLASNNNNNQNDNNNSISYLAPFVASVLRDQVVTDLLAELQREREERLRIEITGPGGTPTYSERSMKEGVSTMHDEDIPVWLVHFDDTTEFSIPNFIETVAGLEVRVSGVVVLTLEDATFFAYAAEEAGFNLTPNDELQMGRIGFANDSGVGVVGRAGPILYEDYIKLPTQTSVPGLVRFLRNHRTHNPNDTVLLQEWKIDSVFFHQSQITGVMSVLQSI